MPVLAKPAADGFYEGLDSEDFFDEDGWEGEEEESEDFDEDVPEEEEDEDAPQDTCARDVG